MPGGPASYLAFVLDQGLYLQVYGLGDVDEDLRLGAAPEEDRAHLVGLQALPDVLAEVVGVSSKGKASVQGDLAGHTVVAVLVGAEAVRLGGQHHVGGEAADGMDQLAAEDAVVFQLAVEYLLVNNMVTVNEYPNPRSDYNTKGLELDEACPFVAVILAERDEFIRILLELYRANVTISQPNIEKHLKGNWDLPLWISIMKIENVLNALPGRADQFSLFRTHHTVKLVANDDVDEVARAES